MNFGFGNNWFGGGYQERVPASGLLFFARDAGGTLVDTKGVSPKTIADNSAAATYFVLPNADASNHVRYSTISLADCAIAGTPATSINGLFSAGGAGTKIVLGDGVYLAAEMSAGTSGVRMAAVDQQLIGVRGGIVTLGSSTLGDNTIYASAAGHLIQNVRPVRGSGGLAAIYSRPGAGNTATIEGCYFSGSTQLYQENGLIIVKHSTFVGCNTGLDINFAGSNILFVFNTVKNSDSQPASQISIQTNGAVARILANVFSGHKGEIIRSSSAHISGSVDFYGNLCLPPDTAVSPQGLNVKPGITGTVAGNYFAINPRLSQAPTFGAAQTIGTNYYSEFPGITRPKATGYLTFSIDDYNEASYDTWTYLYGTDGTDGLVAKINSFGAALVWYVNSAALVSMPDYANRITWLLSRNIEFGCHGVTHGDVSATGKIFDVVKGAETVTVDRSADTITLSGGGSVASFRTKTLAQIKTTLEGLGATVTPVAAYDSGAAGMISPSTKGEAIDNVVGGGSLSILRGDDTEGYIKCEIYDDIDTLETIVGVGNIKSFAYPFGSGRLDDDLKTKLRTGRGGQLTSARAVLNDANSPVKINGIDRYSVATTTSTKLKANTTPGDATADLKANVHGLCAYLAENGGYSHIYCHANDDFSIDQWNTILAEAYKWSEFVNIGMSAGAVMDELLTIATDTDGVLSYSWADNSNYRLLGSSALKSVGAVSFVPADGDQYDADGYMVYSADFDAGVYHARDGFDIGPYQYGSDSKVYNHPVNVSGSGLTGTYTLPICPTLLEADQGNTIYSALFVPNQIDLSAFVDTAWMRHGPRAWEMWDRDLTATEQEKADRYNGN